MVDQELVDEVWAEMDAQQAAVIADGGTPQQAAAIAQAVAYNMLSCTTEPVRDEVLSRLGVPH